MSEVNINTKFIRLCWPGCSYLIPMDKIWIEVNDSDNKYVLYIINNQDRLQYSVNKMQMMQIIDALEKGGYIL